MNEPRNLETFSRLRISLPRFFSLALLILLLSGFGTASFGESNAQAAWKKKLEERRAQAAQQKSNPGTNATTQPADSDSGAASGKIVINGKTIRTRKKQRPPSPSGSVAPKPAGSVASSTASAKKNPVAKPTPTPAMVKIKKTKIIGGKILTVEIEVTPTPAPTAAQVPEAASVAKASVPSATGYMLEVMKKLQKVSKTPKGNLRFEAKMIATLREEFMKHKEDPGASKVLDATEAIRIQSDLQRLSSIARGGNIDKKTAEALLKVLFPQPEKKVSRGASPPGPSPAKPSAQPEGQETASNDFTAPATEEPQPEPEYYYDPQTGQYYYADGTPVETTDQESVQYYYDQDGNLYYELDGEIYYVEDDQQ